VSLSLPPLRNRSDDIPILADYFLAKFSHNLSVRNPGILPDAKDVLLNYHWPGNVRELANTMEKCLIFSNGHPGGQDDVAHLVVDKNETAHRETETIDEFIKKWAIKMIRNGNDNLLSDSTNHVARIIIEETLAFFNGNRSQTAKRLGISRPTLQKKIASFGIDPTRPDYTDK
jgi:two-component system nitrogen regulation response regulator GlnG